LQSHESKEQKAENKEQKTHEGSKVVCLSFGRCFLLSACCSSDFAILLNLSLSAWTEPDSED